MPAPLILSPLALRLALAGGTALALAAIRARRARSSVPRDDALDAVEEGLSLAAERAPGSAQVTIEAGRRRVLRLGRRGPGVEIDVAAILRGRARFVRAE